MTYNTQPEALLLADDLEASSHFPGNMRSCNNAAAAELRRQHALIAEQQATTTEAALGDVYAELPVPTASIGIDDSWHEPAMRDFADRTHALRMEQAAPKAAPGESDPADIIAGALQISRGHAIEIMREALEAAHGDTP